MKIISLLNELERIIQESTNLPLSSKILVNPEQILEIIQEILQSLPDDMKEAQWVKEERKKILIEAQKDAERVLGDAESKIREMVDENQITQSAYLEAEEIRKRAEDISKEIRQSTNEYADNVLKKMQFDLKSLMEQIENNRKELRGK
ncbi:ATPase [Alkalibaculum sp. M08DMB]|uniref:ATPase n=1 Tax=Alkalibaculum sporogenes TaxID=2655001 RepID=A0A6A7K9L1_9FIRM|nr:ATPase [Alkalibaculum sporogenes]MPW26045.1 ATPase [Alkalibaculum sporogenes]